MGPSFKSATACLPPVGKLPSKLPQTLVSSLVDRRSKLGRLSPWTVLTSMAEAEPGALKHALAKEAVPDKLQELQDKEDPTEEDLDAELAAAKQAATTKSGRLLARSFGFRSKKALQPAGAVAEGDEEAADEKAELKTP